jgi:hypothetical protein
MGPLLIGRTIRSFVLDTARHQDYTSDMVRHTTTLVAWVIPLFLVGCESADIPGGPGPSHPEVPATTRDRLVTEARSLDVLAEDAAVTVSATRHTSTVETGEIDLAILGGRIELSADDRGDVVIDALQIQVDDVVLSAEELPPHGITLTDISLTLAAPATGETTWQSDGDFGTAEVTMDLDLDWALLGNDGAHLPLGIKHITGVAVTFDVASDAEGRVVLTLHAARAGQFWDWAGIVELSDLSLALTSIER